MAGLAGHHLYKKHKTNKLDREINKYIPFLPVDEHGMNEYDRQLINDMRDRQPSYGEIRQHTPALEGGMKMLPNPMNPETGLWEGYEKPLCRCGNPHDVILEKLGGLSHFSKLIKKHHYIKYKSGKGLTKTLHQGITKGLNLLGNMGMDTLIEVAVGILGERFRKPLTKLIKT